MHVLIFILGITIGSFLNVCVYRIPRGDSILYPSSYCPNCGTALNWYDLIPILSYTFQWGKCRYCREPISLQYPVIEYLNGFLYLITYSKFGLNIDFIFYVSIFSILIVISFIDLYTQIIPDYLNVLIFISAIIYKILSSTFQDMLWIFFNSMLGLIISSGIFLIIIIVSKGGMGGGDAKLIGGLGFILGIKLILLNIFLSFVLGAIISIFLLSLKIKGRKDPIPFGPFICLSFIITIFCGDAIINWYVSNLL